MSKRQNDLGKDSIGSLMVRLALPAIVAQLVNALYNIVDRIYIGHIPEVGDIALTGLGLCFSILMFVSALAALVGMGGGSRAAIRMGENDMEGANEILGNSAALMLLLSVCVTVIFQIFKEPMLYLFGASENTIGYATGYLGIYLWGTLFVQIALGLNNFITTQGFSTVSMATVLLGAVTNIVLDPIFIFGLDMGVQGAALATIIGQALSALLGLAYLMSGRFVVQIRLKGIRPDGPLLREIFHLGLPSGFQNSAIAIANLVVQSNINAFGDAAMAGSGSYFKIEGFAFLPVTCLTMAMTTFVGQNIGAQKYDRVKQGAKLGSVMIMVLIELVGVTLFLFAPSFISLFSSTPEVIAFGVRHARVTSLFFCLLGFSHAAAAILRGAGKTVTPMLVMMSVWCVFRIAYITVVVALFHDITFVYTAYPVTWTISSILYAITLFRGHWLSTEAEEPNLA